MKFKSIAALMVVVAMLASLAYGCAKSGQETNPTSATSSNEQTTEKTVESTPKEKVKISFLYQTSGDQRKKDAQDNQVNTAKKLVENEIELDAQDIGAQDITQYVKMKAATGDLPDIMNVDGTDWYVNKIAMELPAELKDMCRVPQFGTNKDGIFVNFPLNASIWGMIYNKDYFEKAGITSVPKTWDELMAACEKLKAAGIAPWLFPLKDESIFFNTLSMMGAEVYSKNPMWNVDRYEGRVTFENSPEWRRIFEKYEYVIEKGYVEKSAFSLTSPSSQDALAQGKAAMLGILVPALNALKDSEYQFGAFPMPNDQDANTITESGGNGIILKYGLEGDKLDAAVKFVKALFSPDAYKYYLDWTLSPSTVKGFEYTPVAPSKNTQKALDDFVKAANTLNVAPLFGTINGVTVYQDSLSPISKYISLRVSGKKVSIDESLKEMDALYEKAKENEKRAAENAGK